MRLFLQMSANIKRKEEIVLHVLSLLFFQPEARVLALRRSVCLRRGRKRIFQQNRENNLIKVVSVHFKTHTTPFGRTSNFSLLAFLLQQVLVNECFSRYNRDPTAALIRFTFCNLDRTKCQRLAVSLRRLMT